MDKKCYPYFQKINKRYRIDRDIGESKTRVVEQKRFKVEQKTLNFECKRLEIE